MQTDIWQWRAAVGALILLLLVGCERQAATTPTPAPAPPPARDLTVEHMDDGVAAQALHAEILNASRGYTSARYLSIHRFDPAELDLLMAVNPDLTAAHFAARAVDPELPVDGRLMLLEILQRLEPEAGPERLATMLTTATAEDRAQLLQWMYFADDPLTAAWAAHPPLLAAVAALLDEDPRARPLAIRLQIPAALAQARRDLADPDPRAALTAAWNLARVQPDETLAAIAAPLLGGPETPLAVRVLEVLLATGHEAAAAAAEEALAAHLSALLVEGYDSPAGVPLGTATSLLDQGRGAASLAFAETVLAHSGHPPLLAAARLALARRAADRHHDALAAWAHASDDDATAVPVLGWLYASSADPAVLDALVARAAAAGDAYRAAAYCPAVVRITGDPASPVLDRLPRDTSPGGTIYDRPGIDTLLDRLAADGLITPAQAADQRAYWRRQPLPSTDEPLYAAVLRHAGLAHRVALTADYLPRHHLLACRLAALPGAPAVDLAWQRASEADTHLLLDITSGSTLYRCRPRRSFRVDIPTVALILDTIAADTDSPGRLRQIATSATHTTLIWTDPALDAILADLHIPASTP